MEKFISYMRKNSSQCIFIAILLLFFIIMIILWIRRGTYSLEDNYVSLACADGNSNDSTVECDMTLHYNNSVYGVSNPILSVNGNFSIPNGVQYSFVSSCNGECSIDENTTNGFAIGKTDGLSDNWLFGKLIITVPANLTSTTDYQITLTNLALSDSNYEMVYLSDSTDTLTLTVESASDPTGSSEPSDPTGSSEPSDPTGSSEPSDPTGTDEPDNPTGNNTTDITFDNSISVVTSDTASNIIKDLPEGENYSYLLSKVNTDLTGYDIHIFDRNGNELSQSNQLKAFDKIVFTKGDFSREYRIIVRYDINGDGSGAGIGDVAKLHDVYKHTGVGNYVIDDVMKYACDINGTADSLADVAKLHSLYKSIQK